MADLTGDDISRAFSAHPGLPFRVRELLKRQLKDRLQKLRIEGDIATANMLARLANDEKVTEAARELFDRHDQRKIYPLAGNYLRPTIDALLWQDTRLRAVVRADPQHAHKLQAYECAAHDEIAWRICIAIEMLSELAKKATQFPNDRAVAEVTSIAREAEIEGQAAEDLRAHGYPDGVVARQLQQAEMRRDFARKRAHQYAEEYRDNLLLLMWCRAARHFGFNGYSLAAALVSSALGTPISARHARHVVKKFLQAQNNSCCKS